jgi:hypothetical protein
MALGGDRLLWVSCSLLSIVDMCLEEDLDTFKASVQDLVDELEEMRRECSNMIHKAHVTRLMFIITRCSRLVLTGEAPHDAVIMGLPAGWSIRHAPHDTAGPSRFPSHPLYLLLFTFLFYVHAEDTSAQSTRALYMTQPRSRLGRSARQLTDIPISSRGDKVHRLPGTPAGLGRSITMPSR